MKRSKLLNKTFSNDFLSARGGMFVSQHTLLFFSYWTPLQAERIENHTQVYDAYFIVFIDKVKVITYIF